MYLRRHKVLPTRPDTRPGAAAVELAVLLPFIALMFVIAVDFTRIFYYTQIVENCARNGAYYAADSAAPVSATYASIQEAAQADSPNLNPQPTITSTTGTDAAGNDYVRVTATWQFKTLTSFPGVPNTVNISRTVQMRVVN